MTDFLAPRLYGDTNKYCSNIGPWVGCPLQDAVKAKFGKSVKVAFQGVSAQDYSADLNGYIEDGGSAVCADSLARSVKDYAARCPSAKIVISGWRYVVTLEAKKSMDRSLIPFL